MMGAAAVAWVLFIIANYVSLVSSANSMWEYEQAEKVRIASFIMLAAVIILGLGALFAKRKLAPLRTAAELRSTLVSPVSRLASLMLIVAAVIAAWTVFFTFMDGLDAGSGDVLPLVRLMNLYLPIVLYTVLVVTLILAGFVFLPSGSKRQAHTSEERRGQSVDAGQAPGATQAISSDQGSATRAPSPRADVTPKPQAGRRTAGFAYAVPIVAVAFALILGLIVYDLTRTALQVWIWVAIFVIVGAGILAGTVFANRSRGSNEISAPVVTGAKNLNFVLTVIFAVVVASMSLGYSSLAVTGLRISPSLSLSVYSESEKYGQPEGDTVTIGKPQLSLWGSDLKRGSEAVVVIDPDGTEIMRARVDRNRWANVDKTVPENLAPGTYAFIARAEAVDGVPLEISLPATVKENGDVSFPSSASVSSDTEKSRLLPVTVGWLLGDLLPAGVLLGLGIGLVSGTILVRNPERSTRS